MSLQVRIYLILPYILLSKHHYISRQIDMEPQAQFIPCKEVAVSIYFKESAIVNIYKFRMIQ